jgi:hypothetical protein
MFSKQLSQKNGRMGKTNEKSLQWMRKATPFEKNWRNKVVE